MRRTRPIGSRGAPRAVALVGSGAAGEILQSPEVARAIKASFGYDPLACPRCGRILELAEIREPQRGHIWMKRWLETHRLRKAARDALAQVRAARPRRSQQLAFDFFDTS